MIYNSQGDSYRTLGTFPNLRLRMEASPGFRSRIVLRVAVLESFGEFVAIERSRILASGFRPKIRVGILSGSKGLIMS